MNLYVKNLLLLSITILVAACGGGSSSSNKLSPYSLDDYRGRNVSSDSLAGTWVSVSEWQAFQFYDDIYRDYLVAKEYFVITENDGVYARTSCDIDTSDFLKTYDDFDSSIDVNSEDIERNGDEVSFGWITGTVIDNQYLSMLSKEDVLFEGKNYSNYTSFKMIKISDSTESIGISETLVTGNDKEESGINCLSESKWLKEFDSSDEYTLLTNYLLGSDTADGSSQGIELREHTGLLKHSYINFRGLIFQNQDANIELKSKSNSVHNLSYSGSHGPESLELEGSIQVQLPAQ
jgi:hypothetical protein